jgi:hypothetical protein
VVGRVARRRPQRPCVEGAQVRIEDSDERALLDLTDGARERGVGVDGDDGAARRCDGDPIGLGVARCPEPLSPLRSRVAVEGGDEQRLVLRRRPR